MSTNPKKRAYRLRDGVSLLISLGLVSVIVFFGLIVSNIVVTSIRQAANVNRANEAYYAAEGALEQGLMLNSKQGAGYSAASQAATGLDAEFTIQGQVPANVRYENPSAFDGMYGAPTPGTGDVGSNCDILEAWTSKGFDYNAATDAYTVATVGYDAADHPCNWNKIGVGDVVSIPLYVNDPVNCTFTGQDGICNPVDLSLTDLRLRVRTPCGDGEEMCTATTRYTLDDEFGGPELACDSVNGPTEGCGDTIISWSISGTNITGDEVYDLKPLDDYKSLLKERFTYNSEIYEFLMNNARIPNLGMFTLNCDAFCVLNENRGGKDLSLPANQIPGSILQFLTNASGSTFDRTGNDRLHKPVLKLAVINSLKDKNSSNPVPYLEYQLISTINASYTPTDTSQTITAEGYSGEFKQILEVKQPQEGGLLEYVIQQ